LRKALTAALNEVRKLMCPRNRVAPRHPRRRCHLWQSASPGRTGNPPTPLLGLLILMWQLITVGLLGRGRSNR
jgi:hypothetical protein